MSRLKPAEGWSSLILLTLMLLTVAWSIEAAQWAQGLVLLQAIVLGAILVSFVLAELRVPYLIAHSLGTLIGVGWTLFLVGRTLEPASVVHRIILDQEALTWRVRLTEIVYRVQSFIEIARSEGVGVDNLVFVLQLAILLWLIGYASTWFLFRSHTVWGAIVPGGFAMLLNLYYAPPDLYVWMALYLLCALLLIVRSNVFIQESEWRQAGVNYAPDIGYDFLWQGAVFALIVILFAWVAPTTSAAPRLHAIVDQFNEPVYRFQREFSRLYSSLNYTPQPGPAYFGDTMTLSGAVNLADTPVFDVVTTKGRYWRGVVYDEYTGRGWVNTATDVTTVATDDLRLDALEYKLREPVTQTIRILQPGMTQLHMLPQPSEFNMPVLVQYSPIPESTKTGVVPLNVSTVQSRRPLETGETYTVISSISVADVQSLREAGTNYPDWVKNEYLQLPDELPPRVRELAARITSDEDNPYDKVTAIEHYLRQIKYDENIPAPPAGVDSVDWFLFQEQAGYCDYYASSLVVMARSLGIPARVAAGYSRGDFDAEIGAYRQRAYDAHSWPEVFFPGYGWVEFEPTAADPEIARPVAPPSSASTDSSSNDQNANDLRDQRLQDDELRDIQIGGPGGFAGLGSSRVSLAAWVGLALLGAIVLFSVAGWLFWQRAFQGLSLPKSTYARMVRVAAWLGLPAEPSQTPNEYANRLSTVVPEGQPAIGQIANAYVLELFAEVSPDEEEASSLREAWLGLRRTLVERIGLRMLQRVTGSFEPGGKGAEEQGG